MQHSVDLWNKLYLGILLAAALLGILGVAFAGRVVSLTRKLDKTKTEQYQREKQTNDVKIEQAREKASIADENAAKANRESMKLSYELESVTAESRSKAAELAREQQKLAVAQRKLAQAEQRRDEAQLVLEKTLEDVRQRQMPRTLTDEQRTRLVRLLRSTPRRGGGQMRCWGRGSQRICD